MRLQIDVYERALPAYRASLEDRYPPVCSACAPQVQTRLQRNNYIAKSSALGKWLTETKGVPRTGLLDTRALKAIQFVLWLTRLVIWGLTAFLMISWYLCGVRSPANQKFGTQLARDSKMRSVLGPNLAIWYVDQETIAAVYSFCRRWLPISLLGAFWNPKGFSKIIRPSIKFAGSSDYAKLQCLIQIMRFGTVYCIPLLGLSVELHSRLSALFLVLSICHLLLSFTIIKEVPLIQLNLKDRSNTLADSFSETENYSESTIQQSMPLPPTREHVLLSQAQYSLDEPEQSKDELMDWQPSPPNTRIASPSPFITSTTQTGPPRMFPQPVFSQPREQYFSTNRDYHTAISPVQGGVKHTITNHRPFQATELKKQTFFAPERPTGLENLFNAAVRLDDEPILVQSIKSVRRNPLPSALVLTCLATLAMMTIRLTIEMSLRFEAATSCATLITAWYLSLIGPRRALGGIALLSMLTVIAYLTTIPKTREWIEWVIIVLTVGHQISLSYELVMVHNAQKTKQTRHKKKTM